MNYYSLELKEKIKNDYINGINFNDIVEKYKLERQVIRYILKKTGVYRKTKTLNQWTNEEKEQLKKYYAIYDFNKIDELFPNHSHKSIVNMCHKLRLNRREYRKNNKKKFDDTIYDTNIIYPKRELINKSTQPMITYPTVKNINKKSRDDWYTKEEMDFIINNYKKMSDKEIGEHIGRTSKSVQAKRLQLGIKRQGNSSYFSLQEYLRKNNIKWKKDSMKNCEYKCVITGQRFDEIHHIVGFNYIVDITLHELNYGYEYDTRYYNDEELKTILYKFREVQQRYPLGVCLTKELHEKFHRIYGYGNNTEDQWNEFYNNNK